MKLINPLTISTQTEFTRSTTGTYFDVDGILRTAAIDEPRYQYNPATGAFEGLLIEDEATNYVTQSQSFASWTTSNATVTTDQGVAPDGTNTATRIDLTADSNSHIYHGSIPAGAKTISVYAKGSGQFSLWASDGVADYQMSSVFTLTDDWVLYEFAYTISVTGYVYVINTTLAAQSFLIWGYQAELGAKATSRIPTTSAAVTRAADAGYPQTGAVLLSNVPEDDYAFWDSGTTYDLDVFKLYGHKIYKSLQNANLNHNPVTATTWWQDQGYNNRWKMFDQVVGSKTTQADSVAVSLFLGSFDSVAFLDLADATRLDIALVDPTAGVVYTSTVDLVMSTYIQDAYTYCFEPVSLIDTVVFTDIPNYPNAILSVMITNASGSPQVGTMVVGDKFEMGTTDDASIGIKDYSIKTTDDFGNFTILERVYSKRFSGNMYLPNTLTDELAATLSTYTTTAVVWITTDEGFGCMTVYGFYKDFQITIPYETHSDCSLEIEGLA